MSKLLKRIKETLIALDMAHPNDEPYIRANLDDLLNGIDPQTNKSFFASSKWRAEGFEKVYASTGQFYGGLIIDEDDTIIAQNVMPDHVSVIVKAREMLELLKSIPFFSKIPTEGESDFCKQWNSRRLKLLKEIEGE